jgi:gamma-glutamylcyclotransferase (GGCT)/AIG2-like uncharacterized protein YtfP
MAGEEAEYWDVFVYGTLRRGGYNHHYLRGCRYLGAAATVAAYAMYVHGGIPYLVAEEARYRVTGEAYRVDAAALRDLDALEEHPRVYCRREAEIVLEDGRRQQAWIYFARGRRGFLSATGDFTRVCRISTT